MENKNNGFILDFWERVFSFLSYISAFYWIRRVTKNKTYTFVDIWVVSHVLLSLILSLLVYQFIRIDFILVILSIYAALRIFEIIIYQINVLLFDPYRARKQQREYYIKSPTRMVILLLHNYLEIIIWFSMIVLSLLVISGDDLSYTWFHYLKSSILCFATLNQDSVIVLSSKGIQIISIIAFFEFIAGLIMTTITLARFIGLLPAVKFRDDY